MKVTFISDTHNRQTMMYPLPGGDVLIFAGDFMSSGYSQAEVNNFISWIKNQPYKYKVCIAGNHDRYCETFPSYMVKDMFEQYYDEGVRYIQNEEIEIEGLKIYGTPHQPYFCDWAFNVPDSERLYSIYQNIPGDLDILITHCPPYDVLDKSHLPSPSWGRTGEEPLGSKELQRAISELGESAPRFHVFGHIHGDGGKMITQENTTYINASVCDEQYKPVNNVITLDIEPRTEGGE